MHHPASSLLPWVFARRFSDGVRWIRATGLCAKRRFEDALKVARTMSSEAKQRNDWRVFEIQQLNFLRWNLECLEASNRFLSDQANIPPPNENRRYLIFYAQACAREAFERLAKDSPLPTLYVDGSTRVRVELVSRDLKRIFPITL